MEKTENRKKGSVRLSRSRKGVCIFIEGQLWFTSVKSMERLLNGDYAIIQLRQGDNNVKNEEN